MNRALQLTLFGFATVLAVGAVVAVSVKDDSGNKPEVACAVAIYLRATASPAQIDVIGERLGSDPRVASFEYLSKEAALARMKERFPELVAELTYNPLPDSFEVKLDGEDRRALADELSELEGVERVSNCPIGRAVPVVTTLP